MKPLMIGLLSLISIASYAGAERGNGGIAHVCRDPLTNKINSAEMLDIRRGKKEMGLKYKSPLTPTPSPFEINSTDSYETIYEARAIGRLISNPVVYRSIESKYLDISSGTIPIAHLNAGDLFWTGDGEPGEADPGCHFEQVGVYQNNNLYQNDPVITKMDDLNRAAFYIHESAYAVAKEEMGAMTSLETQKLVALLLAENSTSAQITAQITKMYTGLKSNVNPFASVIAAGASSIELKFIFPKQIPNFGINQQRNQHFCETALIIHQSSKYDTLNTQRVTLKKWAWDRNNPVSNKTVQNFPIPFLSNGIFQKTDHAEIVLTNCGGLAIDLEVRQNGELIGTWSQVAEPEFDTYDTQYTDGQEWLKDKNIIFLYDLTRLNP